MNTKTAAESREKAPAAPVVAQQPETPAKAAGPQHATQSASAAAAPQPNDASSIMRSAEMVANHEGAGAASRARTMMTLQRRIGNNRISSLVGGIQTKLSVGAVDDPHEHEADRVAEAFPQQPGAKPASPVLRQFVMKHSLAPSSAQRQTKEEEKPEPQPGENADAPPIQRKEGPDADHAHVDNDMEHRIASPAGGKPLPEGLRGEMEAGLGADFSQVRVHDNTEDQNDARRLNAKAFTHGEHIWLGAGESAGDRKLMAHELAHVVQQQSGPSLDRIAKKETPGAAAVPHSVPNTARPAEKVTEKAAAAQDASQSPAITDAAALVSQNETSIPSPTTADTASENKGEGQPETAGASVSEPAAPAESPTETPASPEIKQADEENNRSIEKAQEAEKTSAEESEAVPEAESVPAQIEEAPMPTLASLIKPNPEEESAPQPQESTGGVTPGQSASSTFSPIPTPEVSRAVIRPSLVIARNPDNDGENDNEFDADAGTNQSGPVDEPTPDPIAARAAVQSLISTLTSASVDSQVRIQQQTEETKAALTQNAETVRQQVYTQIVAAVASLRAAFASERAALQASISEARGEIATALETRRAEAISQGEEAKAGLTDLFAQQHLNVAETVEEHVSSVEELRSGAVSHATERTREQATTARHDGDRKNASYPATERGEAQGEAALAVAQRTAREIEGRLPDTIEAINEIVEDIPDEFRDKGEEAQEGIDEGLPDLIAHVDEQVQAVVTALDNQAAQANEHLDLLETQVMAQLESAENACIAQAEALGPQAEAQIEAGLETAFNQLDASVPQANDQIQQIIDQAVEILNSIESPDAEGANEMVQQILGFVTGATDETIAAQREAGDGLVEEFSRIDQATSDGLVEIERETATQLPAMSDSVNSSLNDLLVQLNDGFDQTIAGMGEAFQETEDQVSTQLDQSVEQLGIDFTQTLQEAEAEVTTAVNEGLAHNDEALVELGPKMNEAADDAGWDYDHPILSTIRDIGAIVLGVIAGILLVLALVVVAIVAFKLLVAGLIAAGVAAAVAKVIAVVIAVGLLAYGIYSAYQARIRRGEAGGWATFGGALLDITGITDIRRAFTEEGLSPFERGFAFGRGIATLATFFLGRRLNRMINARLPRWITNPTRGSAFRWVRERVFGGTRAGKGLPGLPKSAPKVAGRGSTGRTTPNNRNEQLAMEQARSNPAAGDPIPLKKGMTDARWPASEGWVKMRQNINGVEIHYVRNTRTGAVDDFKFK